MCGHKICMFIIITIIRGNKRQETEFIAHYCCLENNPSDRLYNIGSQPVTVLLSHFLHVDRILIPEQLNDSVWLSLRFSHFTIDIRLCLQAWIRWVPDFLTACTDTVDLVSCGDLILCAGLSRFYRPSYVDLYLMQSGSLLY